MATTNNFMAGVCLNINKSQHLIFYKREYTRTIIDRKFNFVPTINLFRQHTREIGESVFNKSDYHNVQTHLLQNKITFYTFDYTDEKNRENYLKMFVGKEKNDQQPTMKTPFGDIPDSSCDEQVNKVSHKRMRFEEPETLNTNAMKELTGGKTFTLETQTGNPLNVWKNDQGQYHRENDLPAIIHDDGSCEWWINGQRHRENDKPALIWARGDKAWFQNGNLHRVNKPAVKLVTGEVFYYNNGVVFTPEPKLEAFTDPRINDIIQTFKTFDKNSLQDLVTGFQKVVDKIKYVNEGANSVLAHIDLFDKKELTDLDKKFNSPIFNLKLKYYTNPHNMIDTNYYQYLTVGMLIGIPCDILIYKTTGSNGPLDKFFEDMFELYCYNQKVVIKDFENHLKDIKSNIVNLLYAKQFGYDKFVSQKLTVTFEEIYTADFIHTYIQNH